MGREARVAGRWSVFALLAWATIAVEITAADHRPVWLSTVYGLGWIGVAVVLALFIKPPARPEASPPRWVFILLLIIGALPLGMEPLYRSWTSDGLPLELQMVFALRNLGLGLAACGCWRLCMRTASVVSLFLMLFASLMSDARAVNALMGLYAITGGWWLMLTHWQSIQEVFVPAEQLAHPEWSATPECVSWWRWGSITLLLMATFGLLWLGPTKVAYTFGEFLPTSGGTGAIDPFARSGIGDGPEEVAGDDARSAGMVESQRMIEDNERSLLDAVSDMYGPPHKPRQDQERMVAAGFTEVIQNHGKLPESRRPSRAFETQRQGPKQPKKPGSRPARGRIEIQGRTPLHIRLTTYERYDSVDQRWLEARKPALSGLEQDEGEWVRIRLLKDQAAWYADDETHQLKVADLKDNLVPTPTMLTRFRIQKVDKVDYYEWTGAGILGFAGRRRTPPGVIVHSECRTIHYERIPEGEFGPISHDSNSLDWNHLPDDQRSRYEQLAHDWVGEHARGWPQVQALLTRLRTAYVVDPGASAPLNHPDPVAWFLDESQRGPDYLFASAAVFLLRALHYPARLCMGYYAAPEAYDPETDHTPVGDENLHFWPEIRLLDGHWIVVEPTPGFSVLAPRRPWLERLAEGLAETGRWTVRHGWELSIGIVVLVVVWYRYRLWRDRWAVRWWQWFPGASWREQVQRAFVIIERRGRWQKHRRPRGQTTATWLQSFLPANVERTRFVSLVEWASYAPTLAPPWTDDEVYALCRQLLTTPPSANQHKE